MNQKLKIIKDICDYTKENPEIVAEILYNLAYSDGDKGEVDILNRFIADLGMNQIPLDYEVLDKYAFQDIIDNKEEHLWTLY